MKRALVLVAVIAILVGSWWMRRSGPGDATSQAPETAPSRETAPPVAVPEKPRENAPRRRAEPTENAQDATDAARAGLTVRVVVRGTSDPVAGARVVAEDAEATSHETMTGADGVARFDPPIDSDYARIDVTASGMTKGHHFADKDEMRSGAACTIEVARGGGLDGVVIERGTRRLVGGAHVEAFDPRERSDRTIAEAESAADGTFHLDGVPSESNVALRVTEPHHVAGLWQRDPAADSRIEISLDPAGLLRGVVTDPSGAPAQWASVTANAQVRNPRWKNEYRATLSASTDADGRYLLGGLALGASWTVTASKPGLADAVARSGIELDAAQRDVVCDFTLRAPAHLDIRVVRADGKPATDAFVSIDMQSGHRSQGPVGETGAKLMDVYDPGRCVVRVESGSSPPKTVEIDVEPGATRLVGVTLDSGVEVSGIVVDDLGRPLAGVVVAMSTMSITSAGGPRRMTTAADGTFRFEGIAAGEHEVSAQEPGGAALRSAKVVAPTDGARLVLPRRGSISLRVRAPAGVPLKEWMITVIDPTSRFHDGFALSTARGKDPGDDFRVPVSAGTCTVTVQAVGFVTLFRQVEVAPGADTSLGEVVLDPGLSIEGSVVDAQGRPVNGAVVGLGPPDIAVAQTDASGRFTMTNRAAGEVLVFAQAEGFTYVRTKYQLAPGCAPLVITLRRGGVLRGTVRDADGRPLHHAGVAIVPRDRPDDDPDEPNVDEDGKFTTRLAAGPWRVAVTRGEETVATKDVDLREGEETSVEIVVSK